METVYRLTNCSWRSKMAACHSSARSIVAALSSILSKYEIVAILCFAFVVQIRGDAFQRARIRTFSDNSTHRDLSLLIITITLGFWPNLHVLTCQVMGYMVYRLNIDMCVFVTSVSRLISLSWAWSKAFFDL